jgi:low temperature requirement protein LtrA
MTPASHGPERVTTLELFFDLVFVFTLTQLTTVLYLAPNGRGLLEVVLMLGVIWWMYGGYAWLTNAVSSHTVARRLLLLGGMAAYFVLALSIPSAFESTGLAFGLAYLVIVAIHTALFTRATAAGAARAILSLAPYNLSAALAVLAGGAVGGNTQYVLWGAAGLYEWLTPVIRGTSGFSIAPAHFVERHALVVIVAIGESVVAIGFGASQLPVNGSLVAVAVVGLALSACLWWLYFGGDAGGAEAALVALPQLERAVAALRAFGYWHLPMLLGIVAVAAVEREATAQPFSSLTWSRSAILAGGVAAYLAGDIAFRRELGIGRVGWRAAAVPASLAVIPVGVALSPFAETAFLVALLVAVVAAEATVDRRAATPGASAPAMTPQWALEEPRRAASRDR